MCMCARARVAQLPDFDATLRAGLTQLTLNPPPTLTDPGHHGKGGKGGGVGGTVDVTLQLVAKGQ